MKYCKKCLYPDTKPDISFNKDGICSACSNFENRSLIDWVKRKKMFLSIIEKYKTHYNYDCIVPVSGGKDSTYQVLTLLNLGICPLVITATTDSLTDIGRKNIENIKNLGVDYIEYSSNPIIRRQLNKFCLEKVGDISWPEHVSIFTVPVRLSTQMNIPLIIWGENPQNEYGGPAADTTKTNTLNRRWLEEFGGLLGLRTTDYIEMLNFKEKDLIPYTYPSQKELNRIGVTGLFLGYYFPWDGFANALISQAFGMTTYSNNIEGSLSNYENLDNYQAGIHDYFKYIKYGFGRSTDLANNHIRRGRLTREQALRITKIHDGYFPWSYLGRPLQKILAEIDMTMDEFIHICNEFTNPQLFEKDAENNFIRDSKMKLKPLYSAK